MNIKIPVEICRKDVQLPEYAKPGDAGMDVRAAEDVVIKPGETVIIPTGLKLAIPEGYEVQVRPRSGISKNTKLRVANAPGTIDAGYRDEVGVIMTNISKEVTPSMELPLDHKDNLDGTYVIRKGNKVAQFVLQRVPKMAFEVVESVKNIGYNRGGGYNSTGI